MNFSYVPHISVVLALLSVFFFFQWIKTRREKDRIENHLYLFFKSFTGVSLITFLENAIKHRRETPEWEFYKRFIFGPQIFPLAKHELFQIIIESGTSFYFFVNYLELLMKNLHKVPNTDLPWRQHCRSAFEFALSQRKDFLTEQMNQYVDKHSSNPIFLLGSLRGMVKTIEDLTSFNNSLINKNQTLQTISDNMKVHHDKILESLNESERKKLTDEFCYSQKDEKQPAEA